MEDDVVNVDHSLRLPPDEELYQPSVVTGRNTTYGENASYDAMFGSHYESEKDEDYCIQEDLIQNTKTYLKDNRDHEKQFAVSKAEVNYLIQQQKVDNAFLDFSAWGAEDSAAMITTRNRPNKEFDKSFPNIGTQRRIVERHNYEHRQ